MDHQPLESFSDRLHSRCKLFFDLRMNPDADTQDLAGIYQLEAAVFVRKRRLHLRHDECG
jgi:hypothetical protein